MTIFRNIKDRNPCSTPRSRTPQSFFETILPGGVRPLLQDPSGGETCILCIKHLKNQWNFPAGGSVVFLEHKLCTNPTFLFYYLKVHHVYVYT